MCRHVKQQTPRPAFTLTEVVVSSLLVGVVLYSAMRGATVVQKLSSEDQTQQILRWEAVNLLEEVAGLAYQDPELAHETIVALGPDNGEGNGRREFWDDIDDVDQWNTIRLEARTGDALPYSIQLSAELEVSWVDPATLVAAVSETGLKRVKATLTAPSSESYTLTRYFQRSLFPEGTINTAIEVFLSPTIGDTTRFMLSPANGVQTNGDIEL